MQRLKTIDERLLRFRRWGCIGLAGLLAGCSAGSGAGLDVSGRPLAEGGDIPLAATLPSIQANVFDPFCVVCHAGANAPLGLRLDAASSFTSLVSVRSSQDGSFDLVEPGDPDRSYLIRKLEGNASEGQQMPLGGPPLPQATIDFVRQWISDGALPGSEPPAGAPIVVTINPMPAAVLGEMPAEITAGFDQDIDAATVNAETFRLVRSVDGQFGNGDDVAITAASVGLSAGNPRVAVMDLAGVDALEDRYRITLLGSGPSVIMSVGGQAMDGEFAGSLPSGDGTAGGDFVTDFEVRGLQASLASIQSNIFSPTCASVGCHSGPAGAGLPTGMDLSSADASFASLVNVMSAQVASLNRVTPGDADQSYLVQKLEGTAAVGSQMPLGGPFLDQATIDVIRQWIDAGAAP